MSRTGLPGSNVGGGPQLINLAAGAEEFTKELTIIDRKGENISGDTIVLALWPSDDPANPPTAWLPPDYDPPQAATSQRVVALFVGTTLRPAPGTYWLWIRITDNPVVAPRVAQKIVIV